MLVHKFSLFETFPFFPGSEEKNQNTKINRLYHFILWCFIHDINCFLFRAATACKKKISIENFNDSEVCFILNVEISYYDSLERDRFVLIRRCYKYFFWSRAAYNQLSKFVLSIIVRPPRGGVVCLYIQWYISQLLLSVIAWLKFPLYHNTLRLVFI